MGRDQEVLRLFPKELSAKFNLQHFQHKLSKNLNYRLKNLLSSKDGQDHSLTYEIRVNLKLNGKHFKKREKIKEDVENMMTPYWVHREYLQEGQVRGGKEVPFNSMVETSEDGGWILRMEWENKVTGRIEEITDQIREEVNLLLSSDEIHWCKDATVSIYQKNDGHGKQSKEVLAEKVSRTRKLSAFNIQRDKGKLKDYYSQTIVKDTIARFSENRYVRLKWLSTKKSRKGIPHFWFWEDREAGKHLKISEPDDVLRMVDKNVVEFFTSVDKKGEDSPDLFIIETDIGQGYRVVKPKESYQKAWTITKEIYHFLQEHLINCVLQPTGGRGIHIWAGENFFEPPEKYQEILDRLGIEGEKICDLYGFNRVLGKAIGVRLLRKKPDYIKNRYSIAPQSPKKERFYKVLIDTPCVPKGAVRAPLSRHSGTGLADWRVASSSGVKALEDYERFKQSCQPRNVVTYARNHREAYQQFAPKNYKGDFNLLTKELEKEVFLVLYAHQDPDHDYDWALHTKRAEDLYKKWML